MKFDLYDGLIVLGAISFGIGLALIWFPLMFLVGGGGLIFAGVRLGVTTNGTVSKRGRGGTKKPGGQK